MASNNEETNTSEITGIIGTVSTTNMTSTLGSPLVKTVGTSNAPVPPIELDRGEPVPGFPIKFAWQKGEWKELFDKHVALIQNDIRRAIVDDRIVVYLSCPISSRGGGSYVANVEIANHTQQRLLIEWGTAFWILNPAQYQMESKEGSGLITGHARQIELESQGKIKIDIDKLVKERPPTGGDYMRMWTRVLVEDDTPAKILGNQFGAFYFLGPTDVRNFFTKEGTISLTAGVGEYFARKYSMDRDFRENYSPWKKDKNGKELEGTLDMEEWENRRKAFVQYYTIRASANFSKGSHDEWNIWRILNQKRLEYAQKAKDRVEKEMFELGNQIAGYFDGRQVDPGAGEAGISPGYAIP